MRERSFYEQTVAAYMAAVDSLDPDAVMEFFGEDPILVVEPAGLVMRGRGEVRGALAHLLSDSVGMRHEILRLTVDREHSRVAVELNFGNTTKAGVTTVLHDSTHIHLDADGLFTKVQFWLGHDLG